MVEISARAKAHVRPKEPSAIPFLETSLNRKNGATICPSEDNTRSLDLLERARPSGEKLLNLEPHAQPERRLDVRLNIYQMETSL